MAECGYCGSGIPAGAKYVGFDGIRQLKDEVFCCEKCAKARLENKLDEIYDDKAYEEAMEDEDPYARYGVSRSDF